MFADVYAIAMSESDEFTEIVFLSDSSSADPEGDRPPTLKNRVS